MLRYLLTPIARFCIQRGMRLPEVVEACKRCFVDAARETMSREGIPPTAAKISVMTGVHRKDIRTLMSETGDRASPLQKHPLVRLLSFWNTDPEFYDLKGVAPRTLPPGDCAGSIGSLVRRVGGDANPYSLIYALERSGLVAIEPDGSFKLVKAAFSTPPEQGWENAEEMIGDTIECLEHNIASAESNRNLQLKTVFDNIPARFMESLRREIRERGTKFQAEIRELLARYDRDMNPLLGEIEDEAAEISCSVVSVVKQRKG